MALGSVEGRAGFFERPQRQGGWGVAERGEFACRKAFWRPVSFRAAKLWPIDKGPGHGLSAHPSFGARFQ